MKRIFPDSNNDPQRTFCAIPTCHEKVSPRYNVPICHEHMLFCWWIVEKDRSESGQSVEQVLDEDRRREERRKRKADQKFGTPKKLPHLADERGYIYFLQIGDYLKIGYTSDLHSRMRSYPPNSEILVATRGTRDDEQRLHEKFAAYCDSGKEWYRDVPEIRRHVERSRQRPDALKLGELPKPRKGNVRPAPMPRQRGGSWGRPI